MNSTKRIILGGIIGFATPLTIAIGNESLFVAGQVQSGKEIWDVIQVCAFERRWFPLYPKVIHAPGCKNRSLDSIPSLLILTTLGGIGISVFSNKRVVSRLKGKGSQSSDTDIIPVTPHEWQPKETGRIIRGAMIGGIIGGSVPISLGIANEFVWSRSSGGFVEPRICVGERLWNLQRPQFVNAPGCRNKIIDSVPFWLLLGTLSGSLASAFTLVLKKKQFKHENSETAHLLPEASDNDPLDSTPAPVESAQISASSCLIRADTQKSKKILDNLTSSFYNVKDVTWKNIAKVSTIATVVGVIGLSASHIISNSSEGNGSESTGLNPFRQKTQKQYFVLNSYSKAYIDLYPNTDLTGLLESHITREDACNSQFTNSISNNDFNLLLSGGGKVITQGQEIKRKVNTGFNRNYSSGMGSHPIYVNCSYT